MGEVWSAEHERLQRPAAVKVIRSQSAPMVDQFLKEARATAALQSPNVIGVYDCGVANGAFWYAMELLSGLTLKEMLGRAGALPSSRVVHLLHQVCAGLEVAHSRRLIHRDLKPENLFAAHVGLEYDVVKILDFGLVTAAGLPKGEVVGTSRYLAPECWKSGAYSEQSDVWALGCTAYVLLTGHHAFDGESREELLEQISTGNPPRMAPELGVHPALERTIRHCLARTPVDRPHGVGELKRLLTRCSLDGAWTPQAARRWWLQHVKEPARTNPVAQHLTLALASAPAERLVQTIKQHPEEVPEPMVAEALARRLLVALEDPAVSAEMVFEALRELGPRFTFAGPVLVEALTSKSWPMRYGAAQALGSLGPGGVQWVPELLRAVTDVDVGVRSAALSALGFIADDSEAVVKALLGGLGDRDETVVSAAAWALKDLGVRAFPRAVRENIIQLLQRPKVSAAAAGVLAQMDAFVPTDVPHLRPALESTVPLGREIAARSLGLVGEQAAPAVPQLCQMLRDLDPPVRTAVARALGFIGDARAVSPLARSLTDPDQHTAVAAAYALMDLGPASQPAVPALQQAAKDDRLALQEAAAGALWSIKNVQLH